MAQHKSTLTSVNRSELEFPCNHWSNLPLVLTLKEEDKNIEGVTRILDSWTAATQQKLGIARATAPGLVVSGATLGRVNGTYELVNDYLYNRYPLYQQVEIPTMYLRKMNSRGRDLWGISSIEDKKLNNDRCYAQCRVGDVNVPTHQVQWKCYVRE